VLQLQCNFNTKILNIGCYILNIFKNHDQQSNVNNKLSSSCITLLIKLAVLIFVCVKINMKKFISGFLILFLFCNLYVSGGGFQMLSTGHSSAGMAGAVIALQTDGSVIFYNPGGMVFLEKSNVFGGISYSQSRIAFRSNNSGLVDRTESKNMLPFYLGGTIKLSEKMAAGIVINTPFGYNTTWKSDWEGRYIVLSAKLNTLFIQPTFSYKISEKLGIGAGFVFANANYKWNRALIVADGADAQFDGKATGFGFNAGINYAINKKLTAALTYRSKVKLNFKNTDVAFSNIPASLANQYPASANATAEMPLPSVLSIGFSYEVIRGLKLNFETNLNGWSSFDSLNYEFDAPNTTLNDEFRQARKYRDALSLRLGAMYKISDKVTGRAGIAFDQTPVKENYMTPDMPDGDRYVFGIGASFNVSKNFVIEGSYSFETKAEREGINKDTGLNGAFNTLSHCFGVGVNYSF